MPIFPVLATHFTKERQAILSPPTFGEVRRAFGGNRLSFLRLWLNERRLNSGLNRIHFFPHSLNDERWINRIHTERNLARRRYLPDPSSLDLP